MEGRALGEGLYNRGASAGRFGLKAELVDRLQWFRIGDLQLMLDCRLAGVAMDYSWRESDWWNQRSGFQGVSLSFVSDTKGDSEPFWSSVVQVVASVSVSICVRISASGWQLRREWLWRRRRCG